jgi:hypothetical protein
VSEVAEAGADAGAATAAAAAADVAGAAAAMGAAAEDRAEEVGEADAEAEENVADGDAAARRVPAAAQRPLGAARRDWPGRRWPEDAFDAGWLWKLPDLAPEVVASFDALMVMPRTREDLHQLRPRRSSAWTLAGLVEGGALRLTRPTVVVDASSEREGAILCLFSPWGRGAVATSHGAGAPAAATPAASEAGSSVGFQPCACARGGVVEAEEAATAAVQDEELQQQEAEEQMKPPPWAAAISGWAAAGRVALRAAAARLFILMQQSFPPVRSRSYDSSGGQLAAGALVVTGWRLNRYGSSDGFTADAARPPGCGWSAPKGKVLPAEARGVVRCASSGIAAAGAGRQRVALGGSRNQSCCSS